MSNQEARISPRVALVGEQAENAVSAVSQNGATGQLAQNRIASGVRNRRALRIAPPIDDGFRPFRVF